jgi:hypothetical protein
MHTRISLPVLARLASKAPRGGVFARPRRTARHDSSGLEDVEPLTEPIEYRCVGTLRRGQLLDGRDRPAIDHIDKTRLPDRRIKAVANRIEPCVGVWLISASACATEHVRLVAYRAVTRRMRRGAPVRPDLPRRITARTCDAARPPRTAARGSGGFFVASIAH